MDLAELVGRDRWLGASRTSYWVREIRLVGGCSARPDFFHRRFPLLLHKDRGNVPFPQPS